MIVEAQSAGRVRHPHRMPAGAREGAHPLPQGRRAAPLPGAAAHLPQRADRAHQDHVRPGHQRAPQAAGRQDQLRQVRARPAARAARGHDPHRQRARGRGAAPAGVGQADPAGRAWACRPDNLRAHEGGDRSGPTAWCCAWAPPARARRPRCIRCWATSTSPSARSGRPRTRWKSPRPACARCRSTRRSTGPSPRRCAPSCAPTRT